MLVDDSFVPTWLYIKQHNITKLKYFGKTVRKDPIKYKGSGTYWNLACTWPIRGCGVSVIARSEKVNFERTDN